MAETMTQNPAEISITGGRRLKFDRPLVMGILNVTPDSFSDGGRYLDSNAAIERAEEIIEQGADIIDIGGESSRPGAEPVPPEQELERVLPVIAAIRRHSDIPISIDTVKSIVARQAIQAGADIINDISAFRYDSQMADIAAESGAPVILMHMLGTPQTMQVNPQYDDCIKEIREFFAERIEYSRKYGIPKEQIILDPGIGFGKRLKDNLSIISNLSSYREVGCPIMIGTSRKSFIGLITGQSNPPECRLGGSIASALLAVMNGADIIRVHDIFETVEAIKIFEAIKTAD
jgi:dihydropteroate synthase